MSKSNFYPVDVLIRTGRAPQNSDERKMFVPVLVNGDTHWHTTVQIWLNRQMGMRLFQNGALIYIMLSDGSSWLSPHNDMKTVIDAIDGTIEFS